MEASQLKISPEHIRFKPMTRKKRLELRRENIKAYIKSKPAGTVITTSEFARISATSEQNVYSMIKTMIKRGDIVKIPSEERGQRYSWVVRDSVEKITRQVKTALRYDVATLTQMAKEFAWEEDTDSLRQFIQSLGGENERANSKTEE